MVLFCPGDLGDKPFPKLEAIITSPFFLLVCLLEEKDANHETDEHDNGTNDVWQQKGISVQNCPFCEHVGVVFHRLGQTATETRSDDGTGA